MSGFLKEQIQSSLIFLFTINGSYPVDVCTEGEEDCHLWSQ